MLKSDLQLFQRELTGEFSSRSMVDFKILDGDMHCAKGLENLAQAIQNRLLTRLGEITNLGHPQYGSELFKLIGEPNNWRTKSLAELYIRKSLKFENRIEEVVEITFPILSSAVEERSFMRIQITVKPIGETSLLTISLTQKV